MSYRYIQSGTTSTGGATSLTLTPTSAFKQGSLVILNIKSNDVGVFWNPIVFDNVGNVYLPALKYVNTGTYSTFQYYGVQVIGGATALTVNWAGTSAIRISFDEFSGAPASNALAFDNAVSNSLTGTSASLSLSTQRGNLIAVGMNFTGATAITAGANYILGSSQTNQSTMYRLKSDVTETAPISWTTSDTWTEIAGAYKPAVYDVPKGPVKIAASLGALNSNQSSSQLVRSSTGNLYAIIAATLSGNKIWIYKSSDNGATWALQDYANSPKYFSTTPSVSVAIDSNDIIHIFYFGITTALPKYVQYSATTDTFGRVEVVSSTSGASANSTVPAITVDSNNIPHVVWSANAGQTLYRNRLAGLWNAQRTVFTPNTNSPQALDIQIDQNNVPQISGASNGSGDVLFVAIGNKNSPSSFTTNNLVSIGGFTLAGGTSLTIDSSGNTWLAYQSATDGLIQLAKHIQTDPWSTWQTAITNGFNGKSVSLAADKNDIYIFYERSAGGLAYDRYDTINLKWLGETIIQANTSVQTTNIRYHNPFVKWSQYFNNGDTGANNQNQQTIEYLFDDGSTIYYDKLLTAQISTGKASITFNPVTVATTTSTSSTSSSTSASTSTSISTSSTSSSTSVSTSTSSTSQSTSTSSTSKSTSTSSTSSSTSVSTSSTSQSTSTSSTSQSTSTSISTSTSSTSQSTSISTSSTSSSISTSSTSSSTSTSSTSSSTSTSLSTSTSSTSSSTSKSTSTSSTSSSISTSSTSSSISTSSTSSSISTSSTSQSTSISTSTSSTSQSTSLSTSISTSSTSSSISTSSTSASTSTSQSTSISSTSSSTSTTVSITTSTSSTSSSTSVSTSTSSTSQSTSTSSTSSSRSTSTSSTSQSTSQSTSTSSTSQSTSVSTSTSSTSQSTSISTSSTSQSTSISTSTSSTSQSTSTSLSTSSTSSSTSTTVSTTTSTSSTSFSTSSTSTSTSTTTLAGTDINMIPRAIIRPYRIWSRVKQPRVVIR